MDSDYDNDLSIQNGETPTLSNWLPTNTGLRLKGNSDICPGCLAVALNKKVKSTDHNHPECNNVQNEILRVIHFYNFF